jgi:hypothetical protein
VAESPWLSIDGRRLYYLLRQSTSDTYELRSMDLSSGRTERLITDRPVTQFDLSPDEREVAFTTMTPTGTPEIWLAPIDRGSPPRRISESADQVAFAGSDLVFRSLENTRNFVVRIGKDGRGRRRATDTAILGRLHVSPDGKWATAGVEGGIQSAIPGTLAISLDSGTTRLLCGGCEALWGPDGKWLYAIPIVGGAGRIAVPLGTSQEPPESLSTLLAEASKGTTPRGTYVIDHLQFGPGPAPTTYAFVKRDVQRNLFRIPLH